MLTNMTIKTKLIALVAFLVFLAAVNGLLGLYGMNQSVAGLNSVYQDRVVPLRDLKMIADAYAVNIVDTNHKVRNGNLSTAEGIKSLDFAQKLIAERWKAYQATHLVEEEKRLVADLEPLMLKGDQATAELRKRFEAGDMEGIAAFSAEMLYPAIDPISEDFTKLIEVQLNVARQEYELNLEKSVQLKMWVQIMFVIGLVAGLTLAFTIINRSVVRPLALAGEAVAAMAGGDLTQPMPAAGRDEIGTLIDRLATMQNGMRDLIGRIRSDIVVVNSSAKELADSAQSSSAISQAQSESASGMAANVEQLSVSIDQVEEHTLEAKSITQASGSQLEESGRTIESAASGIRRIADAVNITAGTIRELEGYSGQISSIVIVIKDIADQTNLLALNAAIEAARAGEQGRGFAVVADEVRKLAERTAHSTEEITGMIDKIQQGAQRAVAEMEAGVNSVSSGVELAHQAGDSVNRIREAGSKVSHVVEDIGFAIREQAVAARDIARRVEQIAQAAEENSAAVAQNAASAERLESLACSLEERIARFQV